MASERYYGTGRRKASAARVYLVSGTDKITINRKDIEDYLGPEALRMTVRQPLTVTETSEKLDACINVIGGGMTRQASVTRHGISRVLPEADQGYRPVLEKAGFPTRGPRMKERKKYGLKATRRASQFSRR